MSSNTSPRGELMEIHRGFPFVISGLRFRTSARVPLNLAGKTIKLRVGAVGSAALIEVTCSVVDEDEGEVAVTLSAEQTAVAPSSGYEYVFFAVGFWPPLLSGPAAVVDHPRAAA